MFNIPLIRFKQILDLAFGPANNAHDDRVLAFVLGDEFTPQNTRPINQHYVVNQKRALRIVNELKEYAIKTVGFVDKGDSSHLSTINYLVGKNATPQMVEQYIANFVQSAFF